MQIESETKQVQLVATDLAAINLNQSEQAAPSSAPPLQNHVLNSNIEELALLACPEAEQIREFAKITFYLDMLPDLAKSFLSQDNISIHYGIIGICKLMSVNDPPIDKALSFNILPKLLEITKETQSNFLKSRSIWILANIASGKPAHSKLIADAGAKQTFLAGLLSVSHQVIDNSLFGIGNIICDHSDIRDWFLNNEVVPILLNLINKKVSKQIIERSIWVICNIIRVPPKKGKIKQSSEIIKCFVNFSLGQENKQGLKSVISDVLWTLSQLTVSAAYHESRQLLIQLKFIPFLISTLSSDQISLKTATIKIFGNICFGKSDHILQCIDHGLLESADKFLNETSKKIIKKQIAWMLSNIAADVKTQQILYQHKGLIQKIYSLAQNKNEHPSNLIQYLYVLVNPIMHPQFSFKFVPNYRQFYYNSNLMKLLTECITEKRFKDPNHIKNCLQFMTSVLRVTKQEAGSGVWAEKDLINAELNSGGFQSFIEQTILPIVQSQANIIANLCKNQNND